MTGRRTKGMDGPEIKIISGGQTGVDRGALDAALQVGISHGGFVPRGRKAEDGPVPDRYQLIELDSSNYLVRTRQNVLSADGTLLLIFGSTPTGGTLRTLQFAEELNKPWWVANPDRPELVSKVVSWVQKHGIEVLNVAGPRESKAPGIQQLTSTFLLEVLETLTKIQIPRV